MAKISYHRTGSPNPQILTSSQGIYVSHELGNSVLKSKEGTKSFLFTPNRDGDTAKFEVIVTVRRKQTKDK
jgi:hypothetical protein